MFFVPKEVNPDDGIFIVMSYFGSEGWSVQSQHHDAEEAMLSLTDGIHAQTMIVQLTDYMFSVTVNEGLNSE